MKITKFTCENQRNGCVTDESYPRFSYALSSEHSDVSVTEAWLSINGWQTKADRQISLSYGGEKLAPYTKYSAVLSVIDSRGENTKAELEFETGKMEDPWTGKWITDGSYDFRAKKVSPKPMLFRKSFASIKKIASAKIYVTALGIYEMKLNGVKVGDDFFAPGFTSYTSQLQYQVYDVSEKISENNILEITVAGGWAVGSFIYTRKNRISSKRQALLFELHILYEDQEREIIKSDDTWDVTTESPLRMADFYDGEVYDASYIIKDSDWKKAAYEKVKINPKIIASYGAMVKAHEVFEPVLLCDSEKEMIIDFGQNFAGIVEFTLEAKKGQKVIIRHAEILDEEGRLNTKFLRTAKATVEYICKEGKQSYLPRLTYMGFRYISIEGISVDKIEVKARALYSDIETIGSFECSNEKINRLHKNIVWSAKSNFVDIPTDCPQRDERMGWTGDIALFAPTACYNFNMSRFYEKWMLDVKAEQRAGGGIPNTIPAQGFGFPTTMPVMAIDFWGDACVLVPWAQYQSQGDVAILKDYYDVMKKYVDACRFWAKLFSFGNQKYIWNTLHTLHFGDWVAPDVPQMAQWQKRSKWTATASLFHMSEKLSEIAEILGKTEDASKYKEISKNVAKAYCKVFTDGQGKLHQEFQTAYVLPIYYGMFPEEEKTKAVGHLLRLVQEADYCIGTGFPGTPYILFALADHGYRDEAFQMLLNTKCPSWLYEVEKGATTIWERWDGLDDRGNCPIGDDGTDRMISYNHYASGAVGDFLYRRVLGIEPIEPGYKLFRICPILGGNLSYAKGAIETPYGEISCEWKINGDKFSIRCIVPVGTECELWMPSGKKYDLKSGMYEYTNVVG